MIFFIYLGETLLTIDHLRKLCHEIQLSQGIPPIISDPVKPLHFVTLQYPPTLTAKQRIYKAGRFVGRAGQHLQSLEQKLNVSIYILGGKSSKKLRQSIDKLKARNTENHTNELFVLFTMKSNTNEHDSIENVKQSLRDEWNKIDVSIATKRRAKIQSSRDLNLPSAEISGDTRWKPKKIKAKDRQKIKVKQCNEQEEEVPPQPSVRPLSMPQQISKFQKSKRS